MFATILGFAPMALNLALSMASGFLSPKNTQYAGHAANLIIEGLSLATRVSQAHDDGRDITDAEIASATEGATKSADDFSRTLAGLQQGGPSEAPIG